MAGQLGQTSRNRKKIQPLNWAEAANAPALKGMVSFLDIKPEDIRNGQRSDIPSGYTELLPTHPSLAEIPSAKVDNPVSVPLPVSVSPAGYGAEANALISGTKGPYVIFRDEEIDSIGEALPQDESPEEQVAVRAYQRITTCKRFARGGDG